MSDDQTNNPDRIQKAILSNIPHIYFNGFANGMGSGDIVTVVEQNGRPIALLNMSFTVAKTLSVSLGQLISSLEEMSGRPIMTTHEIENNARVDPEKQ